MLSCIRGFKIIDMITMVTGGQRSGKSLFAENLALTRCVNPVYLATARIWDEDFRHRVRIHQQRRGPEWTNVEEPLRVGSVTVAQTSTVLLDCLTLLAANWLFECGENPDHALASIKNELDRLLSAGADFILVTNEIGLGGISDNALQRKFADLQGAVNQYVSSRADEVFMVLSGIPVKIK